MGPHEGVDSRSSCSALGRRARLGVAPAFPLVGVLLVACSSDDGAAQRPAPATTATSPTSSVSVAQSAPVQFSGSGDDTTRTFQVAANWELRWRTAAGAPFAVELLTRDGVSRGEVVRAGDRTEGTTFVVEAGEFMLKVTAGGEWSIEVVSRTAPE